MKALDFLMSPFRGKPSVKESATARAVAMLYPSGSASYSTRDYNKSAKQGFEANVTVFSCIMEISRAVASLHLKVKLMSDDGTKRDAPESHPLARLMARPNEYQSLAGWLESEAAYFLLAGNSYVEGVAAGDIGQPMTQPPLEMWLLRPDRMKVIPSVSGGIALYEHRAGSNVQKFAANRVLHRKAFNPSDDLYGMPPLQAAWRALTSDNAAQDWNVCLLQNNGRPSGVLMAKGSLSDEQFNRIKAQVEEKYQGPQNAGRIMIADGEDGLDWKEMSFDAKEMDWLAGRKMSRVEICQAYQVPPELIGDSANKTYANFSEARRSFWIETVLPYADRLLGDLNSWLGPFYPGAVIEYDRSEIDALQEDSERVWTRAGKAVQDGRISINEARAMMGLPAREEEVADQLLIPPASIPAEDLSLSSEEEARSGLPFELKADTLRPKDLARYWKAVDRSRRSWEARAQKGAKRLLERDARAAGAAIRSGDQNTAMNHAEDAIRKGAPQWREFFVDLYKSVGLDFARKIRRGFKAAGVAEIKGDDEVLRQVGKYVEELAGIKVAQISSTTLTAVRRAIKAGLNSGEGSDLIAKRVEASAGFGAFRARAIARTEVVAASNFGNLAGAQSTGLELKKIWITTIDDRTRGIAESDFDHYNADEQTQPIDQPFDVSGEKLGFPGDSSQGASVGNVINCRCALGFEKAEGPTSIQELSE